MNCAFHPINSANARCSACARGLCPACDHRIKGASYCEDCIVAGVEALRRGAAQANYQPHYQSAPEPQSHKSPGLAALLALIPGLGAAYNGQSIKALVHFALTVGMWELGHLLHIGLFGVAGGIFYLFSIFDSYQSAKRSRLGADLAAEDERLKQTLQQNTHVWGGALIAIGALAIVSRLFARFHFYFFPGLLPLLLIVAGFFLLRHYWRSPEDDSAGEWTRRTPPPSVIQPPYDNDYGRGNTQSFGRRA